MKQTRYFEWIAGEDIGEICVLSHVEEEDGHLYLHFTNGDVCDIEFVSSMTTDVSSLKNKFMVEIAGPSNAWTTETIVPRKYVDRSMTDGEDYEIPTLHDMLQSGNGSTANLSNSNVGKLKLIPPKINITSVPSLPTIDDWGKRNDAPKIYGRPIEPETKEDVVRDPVVSVIETTETVVAIDNNVTKIKENKPSVDFNPVKILYDKCKKSKTDVDLTLTINLPSRSMFNLADSEFENGGDDLIDYILKDVKTNMIKSALKTSLKQFYTGVFDGDDIEVEQ
jgi:hypothetical protein